MPGTIEIVLLIMQAMFTVGLLPVYAWLLRLDRSVNALASEVRHLSSNDGLVGRVDSNRRKLERLAVRVTTIEHNCLQNHNKRIAMPSDVTGSDD